MGKGKGAAGVQGRHIYSRASYLHQAATYLASQAVRTPNTSSLGDKAVEGSRPWDQAQRQQRALQNTSRQVLADMRSVTLKAQIRQNSALKRTVCKFCDTLQIEGETATSTVENLSREGRKPWADVLVIRCRTCGNAKRFPVSAPRQKRKSCRQDQPAVSPTQVDNTDTNASTPATVPGIMAWGDDDSLRVKNSAALTFRAAAAALEDKEPYLICNPNNRPRRLLRDTSSDQAPTMAQHILNTYYGEYRSCCHYQERNVRK
ncbi:hypothetical protein HJFPF1_04982 [Paramyrothecium foliicola]|nr:hypothetical protein HJFPF1_04982 [Paramyrothecium foliicola]